MWNVRRSYIGLVFLGLISILSFGPIRVSAGLVWYEPFDELNESYWDCTASYIVDGALRPVPQNPVTQMDRSAMRAYRSSNFSVGTWKFDLLETAEWREELDVLKVYFVSPGRPDYSDYYALSIVHAGSTAGESYVYTLEKWFDASKTRLADYIGEAMDTTRGTFQQIIITRQSSGLMSVYMNSTLILQATDTDITNTSYFGFYTWDDWAFDNVYVYDTIVVGGDMTPLLIGAAIASTTVILAIFLIRRR